MAEWAPPNKEAEFATGPLSVLSHSVKHNSQVNITNADSPSANLDDDAGQRGPSCARRRRHRHSRRPPRLRGFP